MENILSAKGDKFVISTRAGEFTGYKLTPKKLEEQEKRIVFEHTYLVGVTAFVQNCSPAMEEDIFEHLFSEDNLFLVLNRDIGWANETFKGDLRVISFLSTRNLFEGKMLYISGICVDPAFQGYGLGSKLMDEAYKRNGCHYTYSALRTQNPIMKQSFDNCIGGKSYPNGDQPPKEIKDLAKGLSEVLNSQHYDYQSLTDKGTYGSSLYGLEPTTKSNYYYSVFARLDKVKGDSLLCVKKI